MRNVLADLALEVEAATALSLRLARGYDRAADDAGERAFARITAAVGKYWVCKRAPHAIGEAMECLGGNGYVEEAILARLYREAPLNAIWEGSGNVICLDVLRAIAREPDALPGAPRRDPARARRRPPARRRARAGRGRSRRARRRRGERARDRRAARAGAPGVAARAQCASRGRGRILRVAARRQCAAVRRAAHLGRFRGAARRALPAAGLAR
jgi:hypothetical protein